MHRQNLRRSALVAVAMIAFSAPALATDDSDTDVSAEELDRVRGVLEAKGYRDVHDLELEAGRFEAEATNPAGEQVDLELDIKNLEILQERRD